MTVCPTGSSKKPTSPDFLHVTSSEYMSFFPPAVQWFADYVGFLPPFDVDVNAFCALEPPDFPSLDALDLWALVARDKVSVGATAFNKARQLVEHFAWYLLCQCNSGGTPAPPAPPAEPANRPLVNPPALVHLPNVLPCVTAVSPAISYVAGSGLNRIPADYAGRNGTSMRLTMTTTVDVAPGPPIQFSFKSYRHITSDSLVRTDTFVLSSNQTFQIVVPTEPGATLVTPVLFANPGGGATFASAQIDVFCDGQAPNAPLSPCCPPDPGLLAKLDQVVAMVTLIQRQAVPFGYVPGVATHAGLVGSGELVVSGLLGFLVQLTSVPPELGIEAGSPNTLFDAGWVTCGTADGWEKSTRVEHNPRLVVPEAMGLVTRIGYSFAPNVVATITELVREP